MRTAAPLAIATLAGALFPSVASAATAPVAASTSSDLIPALVIAGAGALVIMLIMIVVPGTRRRTEATSEGDEAPTATTFRAHPIEAPDARRPEAAAPIHAADPPAPEPALATAEPVAAEPEPAPTIPEPVAAEPEPAPTIPEPVAAEPELDPEPEPVPAVAGPAPAHPDPEPEEGLASVFAGLEPAYASAMSGATAEMTLLYAEAIAPERATAHRPEPIAEQMPGEDAEMLTEDELPVGSEQIFRTIPPPTSADEDSDVAVFAGEHGGVAVADPPRAATIAAPRPAPVPPADPAPAAPPAPVPDLLSALSPAPGLGESSDPERPRAAMTEDSTEPSLGLGLGRGLGPEPDPRTALREHSLAVPVAACVLLGVAVHLVRARRRR